jgi:autotransporter-associated beta strand protein
MPCSDVCAVVEQVAGAYRFSGTGHSVLISDTTGSIISVKDGGGNEIATGGAAGLWSLTHYDGVSHDFRGKPQPTTTLTASAFLSGGATFTPTLGSNNLVLAYTDAALGLTVTVTITDRADGVDFSSGVTVAPGAGLTVLKIDLPAALRFNPANLQRFIAPNHSSDGVGMAFNPSFFQAQTEDNAATWKEVPQADGGLGYRTLYGSGLVFENSTPVALNFTSAGTTWLGSAAQTAWNGSNAVVNRPPASGQWDLLLIDSPKGPYFSGSKLGGGAGAGYLMRVGGNVNGQTAVSRSLDLVTAAVKHLAQTPAGRTKIGILSMERGPMIGETWPSEVRIDEWKTRISAELAGFDVVDIKDYTGMSTALAGSQYLAILNPYGENIPASLGGGVLGAVNALRSYVHGGGNWFEVGGHPFFFALQPVLYYSVEIPYPAAFADFFQLETTSGNASLFGVQPVLTTPADPWNTSNLFTPGNLAWGADATGGWFGRGFVTHVKPNQSWQSPAVRLAIGQTAVNALGQYSAANGYTRGLVDKIPSATKREAFKQSPLLRILGTAAELTARIPQLPSPSLIHFTQYLKGGFDKEYPDHLPINASFGTEVDFNNFLSSANAAGHLTMPYTNPTFWGVDPKGPTWTAIGIDDPLLLNLNGAINFEEYFGEGGFTATPWHPAVRAANEKTIDLFNSDPGNHYPETDYQVDFLFQDQVGARSWQYDNNPQSPKPQSYVHGLIALNAEDSGKMPISTENGFDRLINFESQFCGLAWGLAPTPGAPFWRRYLSDRYDPATWEIFPLAQYLAHDKVAFAFNNLGASTATDETVAWALGLGYGMTYFLDEADLNETNLREWIAWIGRVQKSVAGRYIGGGVGAFDHQWGANLATPDNGSIAATYGPVNLVANLDPQNLLSGGRTIAPHGFVATAPGMIAARMIQPGGSTPVRFVAETNGSATAEFWIHSVGGQNVTIELPPGMNGSFLVSVANGAPVQKTIASNQLTVTLPAGAEPTKAYLWHGTVSSSSWNVDASGDWITDANWIPASAPGNTSGTTNADVARFGFTLTADRVVTVDANRNIGGITFSNTSVFRFSINGGNLLLSNGGVIQTDIGNGNHTDTISTAIQIQGNGGAATFTAGATSPTSLLSIADVTGVSTGANVTTLTLNGTNTGGNLISGVVGNGAGGGKLALIKSDAGTWILGGTADNTYTGGTSINGGTLQAAHFRSLGTSGNISFGGGTLQYTSASQNSEVASRIKNSSSAIRIDTNGAAVPFGGVIDSSNTGGLIRSGTNTLQFYGASPNTYSGTTTSTGGNLYLNKSAGVISVPGDVILGDGTGDDLMSLGKSEQIADSAIVTLVGSVPGNQGRFRLNGNNETIGGLASSGTGAGMIENGSLSNMTLTLNVTGSQNYSGVIRDGSTGTLSLVKSGAGTQTLTGTNTYSGDTIVNSGTLLLADSGSITSSPNIFVADGATLDVSGLAGGLSLGTGQKLSLGGPSATINGAINSDSGACSLVYDGTNPAFIVPGGGMTLSSSTILSITKSGAALSPGIHKIIGKPPGGGGGSVTGTLPTYVTVTNGTTTYKYAYALSISGGELYLTVTARDHCIVVMGSSVAHGYGSSTSTTPPYTPLPLNGSFIFGYAGLLQSFLTPQGWAMNNISVGGHKTQDALNRYAADLAPLSPTTKFVVLGYSAANEGLRGSANPAAVVTTFNNNLSTLITQCRNDGFQPVVGLNYPRNAYTANEYAHLKASNLAMNGWDVPSINFLGALDDGEGHYVSGYFYEANHPNDAGYQEMFYTIVPSLFDAINAGKTAKPQFGAPAGFARLTRQPGVTEPISFAPEQTVHSHTMSFRVRTTHNGTVAAIRAGSDHATLEIRAGQLVYRSASGQEITAAAVMTDGNWHDVALSFRYALQQTALMVDGILDGTLTEQYVPTRFILGGPSGSGRPETPTSVDFQNWCVYRSAWNQDEAVAQMQGNLQQASMEVCATLDDASFTSGVPANNRAQSLSVAMVNTSGLATTLEPNAPGNLVAQALPGRSAALIWALNGNTESGFVIQRRQSGTSTWSDLAQVPPGSSTYTDTNLLIGVSYDYRVAAVKDGLRGSYSNTATVATGLGVHPTILVDFGPNDGTNGSVTSSPDFMGQHWNNLVSAGGGVAIPALSLTNLVTTTNAATTIGLNSSASGWAANGFLNGGLMSPSQALLGNFAAANATGDYFLTSTSASLTLTNLDSTALYRLRFFGTRNITETRVSRYAATGGNGTLSSDLTTSGTGIGSGGYNGNNNTIATVNGVAPNPSNQIQVVVSRVTGSFAHLGIMEIMPNHPPQAQALSYNAKVGDSLTVDVLNGPNSPTDADGDGLNVTALTGGATIAGGGTGFNYVAGTAGIHQFDYTVSDPYGGTVTSTITVTVRATYESWASDSGIAGADFAADHDGDGIANGIEYAIGGNPGTFTAGPALVAAGANHTLTYPKGALAAADPSIDYAFEVSGDLIHWTEVAPTAEDSSMVSYLLEGGAARKFAKLKITRIPD